KWAAPPMPATEKPADPKQPTQAELVTYFFLHGIQICIKLGLRGLLRVRRFLRRRHWWSGPLWLRWRWRAAKKVEASSAGRRQPRRIERHNFRRHYSPGARRPRQRLHHELSVKRGNGLGEQFRILPTGHWRGCVWGLKGPRLEMSVHESPRRHGLHGPIVSGLQVGRARHARTVDVSHFVNDPHDFRVVGFFGAIPRVDIRNARRLGGL